MKQTVPIGHVRDFDEGACRILEVEGRSIGVFKVDGQLYAVLNVCPHQLAPICKGELAGTMLPSMPEQLEYGMNGYVLRCPAHGWEFDIRTGGSLFGIDRRRLATIPLTISGDVVHATV